MKNKKYTLLILLLTPWLILCGMIVKAYLPIYQGKKYLLPVKPRDPRDFFRGNYVDLIYEFTNVGPKDIKVSLANREKYRFGDILYLDLVDKEGTLHPYGLFDARKDVEHIALKVQPGRFLEFTDDKFYLISGLESFFAPEKTALDWEKALRDGNVFAEVSIDASGNGRLRKLVVKKVNPVSE